MLSFLGSLHKEIDMKKIVTLTAALYFTLPQHAYAMQFPVKFCEEIAEWEEAYKMSDGVSTLMEFTPKGQTIENFTELATIHRISLSGTSKRPIDDVLQAAESEFRREHLGAEILWNVIKKDDDYAIYELGLPKGTWKKPICHEIIKLQMYSGYSLVLGYRKQGSVLETSARERWIEIMNSRLLDLNT